MSENCRITDLEHTLFRGNAGVPFIYTCFLYTLGFWYPGKNKQGGKSLFLQV